MSVDGRGRVLIPHQSDPRGKTGSVPAGAPSDDKLRTVGQIQQRTLAVLKQYIPPGCDVALLDFPRHHNAGDSLIWLGTLRYLARLGIRVRYTADVMHWQPDELRRRVPNGPILITGGGNLGDRWLVHQHFRERIVATFPDRRVVQLPQSVDFSAEAGLTRAQRILGAHPDLVLMARDHTAEGLCRALFPNARTAFCPDLAFGLGEQDGPRVPSHDVTVLFRQDSESTGPQAQFPAWVRTARVDWGLTGARNLAFWGCRFPEDVARAVPALARRAAPLIGAGHTGIAELNYRAACRIVRSGQVLVTDRLHAAVLGRLLKVPTFAIDNSNGKVGDLYRDYLSALGGVSLAQSPGEAVAAAVAHLKNVTAARSATEEALYR